MATTTAEPLNSAAMPEKMVESNAAKLAGGMETLVKTPFDSPPLGIAPLGRPDLTVEQRTKYQSVLKVASEWTMIPTTSTKDAPEEPITEDERMWLTQECLLRYLRASKWNIDEASKRLLATLTWRREYGVANITADYISIESETGKQFILGYDNAARSCLYMVPSKQNTDRTPRQIQHLVFMLERTIDLMPPGQDTLAILINFKNMSSGQGATVAQGRETLNILQNHYPERMGRALVINLPWVVWVFFKAITPFIDPNTKEKIVFNDDLRKHVPQSQLWTNLGGDCNFEYDHKIYWPALNNLAAEKRKIMKDNWIKGGKRVGEHESYLKGGTEKSLAESEVAETAGAKLPESNGTAEKIEPDASSLKVET
ncbi:MAG: hypothetical protein M1824_001867 [Vezdaea acicularis]|nr:MAG: hypothetical protein M1824_001867 [Vezdaea acicularis]